MHHRQANHFMSKRYDDPTNPSQVRDAGSFLLLHLLQITSLEPQVRSKALRYIMSKTKGIALRSIVYGMQKAS